MTHADGISVRFMNSDQAANNLRTPDEIKEFVAKVQQFNTLLHNQYVLLYLTLSAMIGTLEA